METKLRSYERRAIGDYWTYFLYFARAYPRESSGNARQQLHAMSATFFSYPFREGLDRLVGTQFGCVLHVPFFQQDMYFREVLPFCWSHFGVQTEFL